MAGVQGLLCVPVKPGSLAQSHVASQGHLLASHYGYPCKETLDVDCHWTGQLIVLPRLEDMLEPEQNLQRNSIF